MYFCLSCLLLFTPTPTDTVPYDLNNPSLTINLVSADLREISGLSPTETPGIYVTIADEKGEIIFIDGSGGGNITRRVLFRDKGDFEGVEMVRHTLYAVKSDGEIFEVRRWKRKTPKVRVYKTPLEKKDDIEGLGYDTRRHALLVAGKGNPDSSDVRRIYAFSLKTKQLSAQPVYTVDPLEVNTLLPNNEADKPNFFSPSGVAMHPITGDIYVLSSAKKRLVVLDYATGKIKYVNRLDKKILPQPEGIAFDSNGNLHLSSEGKKGEGLVLKFDYRQPKQ